VLLYGPPGTGKTQLVRALARELGDWHVFEVNTTDVLRDPRKFRTLVDQAADHRPAFVFLDEADELLRDRSMSHTPGATNEILKSMDGLMGRVPELVFVAATNSPDALDAAAVRGGRFGEKILLPRLSGEDLTAFLVGEFAKRKNVRFSDTVTPNTLSELFVTIAPADALAILRKAVNYTLSSDTVRPVEMNDVERALKSVIDGLH
jgi:transitional endoplasmic reticulum ATPase